MHLSRQSILTFLFCTVAAAAPNPSSGNASWTSRYSDLPVSFEKNSGQAPKGTAFIAHAGGRSLSLTSSGIRVDSAGRSFTMDFAHPTAALRTEGVDLLPAKSSYFRGGDRSQWIEGVPNYARVRYHQVWDGIDVVYYGNHRSLEYDIVVAPGANPGKAVFQVSRSAKVSLDSNGDVVIEGEGGQLLQHKPVAYQLTNLGRREVSARYVVRGNNIAIDLGQYDHSRELVIDPILVYQYLSQTFSTGILAGNSVAVDAAGNAFFAGNALPAGSSHQGAWAESYDQSGNLRLYFELTASDGDVSGNGVAADPQGNVYIVGSVTEPAGSQGFAAFNSGGFQVRASGGIDAYLLKVQAAGNAASVAYGTYIGGSGDDIANAVALDGSNVAYVVGSTTSANFPSTNGGTLATAGGMDAFVIKINPGASGAASLLASLLAGGNGNDSAQGVAIDGSNNAYVAGSTASTNFAPNPGNGYSPQKTTGSVDGFLLKLSILNFSAQYFTYFPFGPFSGVAVDAAGNAYVTGTTTGTIMTNALIQGPQVTGGAGHALVAKFNTGTPGVNSFSYVTYLGGSQADSGNAIATDGSGNAVVAGWTKSPNFPLAGTPLVTTLQGSQDGFISTLNTAATGNASLVFSTYYGSTGVNTINGLGLSRYGSAIITGASTQSNYFAGNAFTTKVAFQGIPFGVLDTPANNTMNASGAIAVTGWALSTIGIQSVGIYRDPVPGETPGPYGYVFLGNAALVPGARPDVAAAYPGYPMNNYGFGTQILSNELPGTNGKALGNGTYKFHAVAFDKDGVAAEIGSATITVTNTGSTSPFGTLDTPATGGVASGTQYVNFGWALTPPPATIPKDGSTITVFVDGQPIGHPTYNQYRADIATLFPGYTNSGTVGNPAGGGGVGFIVIDTTKLANGNHTIAWSVTDNMGHAQGIGSRQFIVQN